MFSTLYDSHFQDLFSSAPERQPEIGVVGVGGGGGNAINNMIEKGIDGVDFIAINTDAQDLANNKATYRVQVGTRTTQGLGAGARPNVGAKAMKESREKIQRALQKYDMVFVTAGMGGGTGTGGAPLVAAFAREMGILTVGIVTRPFECESKHRMQAAEEGIKHLREHADTLLVIPNDRLLEIADDRTSLVKAFEMADEVLYSATRGVTDLITKEGIVNLDFADVETTMRNGGMALMGAATLSGSHHARPTPVMNGSHKNGSKKGNTGNKSGNRAEKAALEAISSPLFDGKSIEGADKVLVNVTGDPTMGFREAMSATQLIQDEAGEDCEVLFGAVIDDDMTGRLQVTVIATGLEENRPRSEEGVQMNLDELDILEELDHITNGSNGTQPAEV